MVAKLVGKGMLVQVLVQEVMAQATAQQVIVVVGKQGWR